MGDRTNIIIKQGNGQPPVVLYSHWGGHQLREKGGIEAAMEAAQGRAGDPGYYTALFIANMLSHGNLSGVGTALDDNEYPIAVIDATTGKREEDMTEREASQFLDDAIGNTVRHWQDGIKVGRKEANARWRHQLMKLVKEAEGA